MWRFIIVSCILVLVSGEKTEVSQCTRASGDLPLNTYVEGCTTTPCLLPSQSDVVLHIVFRSPRIIKSMTTLVNAYLLPIPIAIPHDLEENAVTCNFLTNTYCPVLEDEVVMYTLRMYIDPLWPVGVAPTLEFFVADTSTTPQTNIWCIRVPIRVVAAIDTLASAVNGTTIEIQTAN